MNTLHNNRRRPHFYVNIRPLCRVIYHRTIRLLPAVAIIIFSYGFLMAEPPQNNLFEDRLEWLVSGLEDARSLQISSAGNLFLVETRRNRILKISTDGEKIDSLGRLGTGDYQFDMPVAIDPSNELKIYVSDRNNRRIQLFDRRFQYLSTLHLPRMPGLPSYYEPGLISIDRAGQIFFIDDGNYRVYRFDRHGRYETHFELFTDEERIIPGSFVIFDDELWIVERNGNHLHRFSTSGIYLGFIYIPDPARCLRVHQNQLWVLGNHKLMNIDQTGEILFSFQLPDSDSFSYSSEEPSGQNSASAASALKKKPVRWNSFDLHHQKVYLLDSSRLALWKPRFSE